MIDFKEWISDEARKRGCELVEYSQGRDVRAVLRRVGTQRETFCALIVDGDAQLAVASSPAALQDMVRYEAARVAELTHAMSNLPPDVAHIARGVACPSCHASRVASVDFSRWTFSCERRRPDSPVTVHPLPVRVAAHINREGEFVVRERPQ